MPAEVATVFSVDSAFPGADIRQMVRLLMRPSASTVVLKQGKAAPVFAVERIALIAKDWPHWSSLPWVVAGRLDEAPIPSTADFSLMQEFKPCDVDAQVVKLLDHFDWAVFFYFTTFHDIFYTVATRQPQLCASIVAVLPQNAIVSCVQGPSFSSKLNHATFYDYEEEGWLPYELATALGEGLPLLLTRIEGQATDGYYRWNNDTDSREDFIWYEQPLAKLERVAQFDVGLTRYQLHRASNLEAYLHLWSMASHSWAIADATLSADTDIERLRAVIAERGCFDIIRNAGAVAAWAYGHIYGGGSDEHHAVFCARDAARTQKVWEFAGVHAISRF